MKSNFRFVIALLFVSSFYMNVLGCGSDSNGTDGADGRRIAYLQIDGDSDGVMDNTVIYSYNDLGQLSQKTYDAGYYAVTESYEKFIYDSSGNLTEKTLEDSDGNILQHFTYHQGDSCSKNGDIGITESGRGAGSETLSCDDNGNIRSRQFDYDGDHIMDQEVKYDFDSSGNIISETYYDAEGNEEPYLFISYEREYNDDGELISKTVYDYKDTIFYEEIYEYHDGHLKKWIFKRYASGEYDSESTIHYFYE